MLYWSAVFFVIALVAAFFGFGNLADSAGDIAKILFFVFVVLFVLSLIAGMFRRRRGPAIASGARRQHAPVRHFRKTERRRSCHPCDPADREPTALGGRSAAGSR